MKKIFKIILFLLFIPILVYADDGIKDFYINATLENNGDLTVQEYFKMNGTYNGMERNYYAKNKNLAEFDPNSEVFGGTKIHNGDDIEVLEVRAVNENSKFDFNKVNGDLFKLVSSANKGDYKVYTQSKEINSTSIRIFLPSSKNKAFYVKYKIKNLAVLHNDVGEVAFNIFGDSFRESITNFKITINIPNNKNVRVWAHGRMDGESKIINSEKVEAYINNLGSRSNIDIRTTFDKNVISNSNKKTNVDALDKIIRYEEDAAARANEDRLNNDKKLMEMISSDINYCKDNPYRGCYTSICNNYDKISNQEFKDSLKPKIDEIHNLVNKKEEENAKSSIKLLKENHTWSYYTSARKNIVILENEYVKKEYLNEIDSILPLIKKDEKQRNFYNYIKLSIVTFIILFIFYILYIRFLKDEKSEFNIPYLRDLPSGYNPSDVEYLIKGKITSKSLSADLLSMINKNIISANNVNKSKKDYILKLNKDFDNLDVREKKVVNLVFNKDKEITLSKFKSNARNGYTSFINKWNAYIKYAYSEASKKEFYEVEPKRKLSSNDKFIVLIIFGFLFLPFLFPISLIFFISAIYVYNSNIDTNKKTKLSYIIIKLLILLIGFISSLIIFIISIMMISNNHYYKSCGVYGLIISLIIFIITIILLKKHKRNKYGATELSKWKAIKKFLSDFGNMKDKELLEVKSFEDYLVYATILGVANKVKKNLKLLIGNDTNLDVFDNYIVFNDLNRCINNVVASSYNCAVSAQSAANSSGSFSSGSGSGGGFSSGGGSFGGGSGGGRF